MDNRLSGAILPAAVFITMIEGCSAESGNSQEQAPSLSDPRSEFIEKLRAARSRSFLDLEGTTARLQELRKRLGSVRNAKVLTAKECEGRASFLNTQKERDNQSIVSSSLPIDRSPVVNSTQIEFCGELPDGSTAFLLLEPQISVSRSEASGIPSLKRETYPSPLRYHTMTGEGFSLSEVDCRYWHVNFSDYALVDSPDARQCVKAVAAYTNDMNVGETFAILAWGLSNCIDEGLKSEEIKDPQFLCKELGVDPNYQSKL